MFSLGKDCVRQRYSIEWWPIEYSNIRLKGWPNIRISKSLFVDIPIFFPFLTFASSIDCGCLLESSQRYKHILAHRSKGVEVKAVVGLLSLVASELSWAIRWWFLLLSSAIVWGSWNRVRFVIRSVILSNTVWLFSFSVFCEV